MFTSDTQPHLTGDLRLGTLAELYYVHTLGEKLPKQADLIDRFFPGLLMEEIPSDGKSKKEPVFDDQSLRIRAVKYHGRFYIGGEKRCTQILGRLTGTAKGSQEKERSTARRIQVHAADMLVERPDYMRYIRDLGRSRLLDMNPAQLNIFVDALADYINALEQRRDSQSAEEKQAELFPIEDEVFEILITNVFYQWNIRTIDGLANVFTWLLLGSFLRGQVRRIHVKYLSTFEPRIPDDPARITKEDLAEGESFYEGDDLDRRFPGIEWYCDRCGEHLNEQPGFDDRQSFWICKKCGCKNPLNMDNIYNCEMEYQNGSAPVDREDFFRALKERRQELEDWENQ